MNTPVAPIFTRCAHWGWDEHRFFGHAVFGELSGRESITGLMALAVTGRRAAPEAIAVLDDIAAAITLADPRIWPLKLTRLVASYGSAIPAVAAGFVMLDTAQIGSWPSAQATRLLRMVRNDLGDESENPIALQRWVNRYLETHSFVWGFGTPFRGRDERLVALRDCMRQRGRTELPHWRTMEALAGVVRTTTNAEPNVCAGIAAACLDLGFSPEHVSPFVVMGLAHTFLGNAVEGAQQMSESLRRLPDDSVNYTGKPLRVSPRARARAESVVSGDGI